MLLSWLMVFLVDVRFFCTMVNYDIIKVPILIKLKNQNESNIVLQLFICQVDEMIIFDA